MNKYGDLSLVEQIAIKIAQSFYPYNDVWGVLGKGTKKKCEMLAEEVLQMVKTQST